MEKQEVQQDRKGTSRRQFIKYAAAAGAGALAAFYVRPVMRSVEVRPAYANVTPTPEPEGCTPGYWKNHLGEWPSLPSPYQPDTLFANVFASVGSPYQDVFKDLTLQDALMQGGGCEKALGRHGVAALLNAEMLEGSFGLTTGQVISMVNAGLSSGDCPTIEGIKDTLEVHNEASCPFGYIAEGV